MKGRVTPRDIEMLTYLFWINYCNTDILGRLFYEWNEKENKINRRYLNIVRRRLRFLIEEGYVKQFQSISSPYDMYSITEKGALVVAGVHNWNIGSWKEKKGYLEEYQVSHALAIGEGIYQLKEGQRLGNYNITRLDIERVNRREFTIAGQKHIIVPDIFTIVTTKEEYSYFSFIEIDNETERISRIKEKIATYEKYYAYAIQKEEWQPTTQLVNPTIIFAVDTEKRIKDIQRIITKLPVKVVLKKDLAKIIIQ